MARQLNFYDMLVLQILEEDQHNNRSIPYRQLFHMVNDRIAEWGIPPDYTEAANNLVTTEVSLSRLREAGLLLSPLDERYLRINSAYAHELWNVIGRDWTKFPVYIPIVDGRLDFANMKERE